MLYFEDPIEKIPEISKTHAKKLQALFLYSIKDLLYHFPFRYEDYSIFKSIKDLVPNETVTIQGKVQKIARIRTRKRRLTITEAYIQDHTGMIKSVWFNVFGPLRFLSKGKFVRLSGKLNIDKKQELHFSHPNFEIISKKQFELKKNVDQNKFTATGVLVPIYPETQGVTSYLIRSSVKKALAQVQIVEMIPKDILKNQRLPSLREALENMHFPKTSIDAENAKKRFAFEKMLLIQLKALLVKQEWNKNNSESIIFNKKNIIDFVKTLPFRLTNAQRKASWEIIQDLEKTCPMNRLLEGDVGTGKTIVAAIATLSCTKQKYQVAFLAPTEVLAFQHFESFQEIFKKNKLRIGLLTGSQSKTARRSIKKNVLKEKIESGNIDVIIGTHALLQQDVHFNNLVLVIIDEQHRFGVKQRALLQQKTLNTDDGKKNKTPHLLTMTATPIPRTLSLAIFGNLDLSMINEFPKNRKKILTKIIPPEGRQQIHKFIDNEVKKGKQVFVIYPLVNETSKINEVKAATQEYSHLQEKIFPTFSIGLLHGKMKPKEKEVVMSDFKNKKIDILISTSVVEVGIDIPNATIMIIEGAERFGLAQLHQFRGRVGRGKYQSYCFLFTSDNVSNSTRRLSTMEKTNDGFKIAQADMKLRGPGQFLGTTQSGIPDIAMEALSDLDSIKATRNEAQKILTFDPKLEKFPLIKKELKHMNTTIHWE